MARPGSRVAGFLSLASPSRPLGMVRIGRTASATAGISVVSNRAHMAPPPVPGQTCGLGMAHARRNGRSWFCRNVRIGGRTVIFSSLKERRRISPLAPRRWGIWVGRAGREAGGRSYVRRPNSARIVREATGCCNILPIQRGRLFNLTTAWDGTAEPCRAPCDGRMAGVSGSVSVDLLEDVHS
jgi:hypothetical protein